jgi:hypothetical protein
MTSFYATLTIADLKRLKGKKMLRGMKISKDGSWFAIKERDTLRQQIRWINAELACREAQLQLPL